MIVHNLYRLACTAQFLKESYSKSTFKNVNSFIDSCFKFFDNEIDAKQFEADQKLYNVVLIEDTSNNSEELRLRGEYNTKTKRISIYVNPFFLRKLQTGSSKKIFEHKVQAMFAYEDTHRQQDVKSNGKFNKSYVSPTENGIKYLNQSSEAAAYGRQVGQLLLSEFPEKTSDQILDILIKEQTKIQDESCKDILKTYTSQHVTKSIREKFFRAAYDYVVGNEG